jgi:NTE family protein
MTEPPLDVVLALGGGAARGLSHVGIIRVLEQHGVRIRGIAGTSIGAIVGGMYCAGLFDEYEAYSRKIDAKRMLRMLDPVIPRSGLLGGSRVVNQLAEFLGEVAIEELPLPFCALATELKTGEEVVLHEGSLVEAIRASFAIPGIFTPTKIDGQWLVDGGVSTPVPIRAARELVPDIPMIAVNLNNVDLVFEDDKINMLDASEEERELGRIERLMNRMRSSDKSPGLLTSISDSITHMEHRIARFQIAADNPDLLLEPAVYGVGLFDFHRADSIIQTGKDCAQRAVEDGELDHLIAKARRQKLRPHWPHAKRKPK